MSIYHINPGDIRTGPTVAVGGISSHQDLNISLNVSSGYSIDLEARFSSLENVGIVGEPEVQVTGIPNVIISSMPEVAVGDITLENVSVGDVGVTGSPIVTITGMPAYSVGITGTIPNHGVTFVDGSNIVGITGSPIVNIGTMPTTAVTLSAGTNIVGLTGAPQVQITGIPNVIITSMPIVGTIGGLTNDELRADPIGVTGNFATTITSIGITGAMPAYSVGITGTIPNHGVTFVNGSNIVGLTGTPGVALVAGYNLVGITGTMPTQAVTLSAGTNIVGITGSPTVSFLAGSNLVGITGTMPTQAVTFVNGSNIVGLTGTPAISLVAGYNIVGITGSPTVQVTGIPNVIISSMPTAAVTGTVVVSNLTGVLSVAVDSLPTITGALTMNASTDIIKTSDGGSVTPVFSKISVGIAGDNTLVAAEAGKKIRVLSLALCNSASGNLGVDVYFKGGDVNILGDSSGIIPLDRNGMHGTPEFCLPFSPYGWCETLSGSGLVVNLSSALQVGGVLTYVKV